jgi:uncharacterized protein (TIGR00369 family)
LNDTRRWDGLRGQALQSALELAPFHAWLALRMISDEDGRVELEMPWREEIISNPRTAAAHGGVLASLIDLAGLYAILTRTTAVAATANLSVDYHRPAVRGPIRARSEIVKIGQTLSVASTQLSVAGGALIASGRGTYIMRAAG